MVNVSNDFKTAIYAPSRKTVGKVVFQIVDVSASDDASASVTGEAVISQKDQVYNTNTDMIAKFSTFENDYWKLDGSFALPPKDPTGYETGWWSNELCGADRIFINPQVLVIDFIEDHSSIGLTLTFDKLANEYAEDFEIDVYDSTDTLIHNEVVIGNTLTTYMLEQNLANYRKIEVTITKWGNAYRRVRLTEISFGIIEEYAGEELINVNVLEEINTISEEVSSNEVQFTVENQDKRFNILNPDSIYPFLQRRQKLIPYFGVEKTPNIFEFVKMGIYYLNEWKSNEGALTATFTGRDILDILSGDEFPETSYTSKTLAYIAEDILSDAGITDYVIDSALQSITVTGTMPKTNYREALQIVAIAGQSVLLSDRLGKVTIKQLSNTVLSETIDFDNMYNSPQIKLDKLINTIYVVVGAGEYAYVDPNKPPNEETLAIKIDNPLIDTNELAEDVAIWVLGELKKRFLYEIRWRGNPALEAGDIVTVEDDFSEDRTMRITRNEFDFAGALSCKTDGKGGGS